MFSQLLLLFFVISTTLNRICAKSKLQILLNKEELLRDIEALSTDQMEGRRTGSRGNALARAYLINRLRELGVQPFVNGGPGLVGYEQPFDYFFNNGASVIGPIPGRNVISFVPGKLGNGGNVIVVSAHYDHLGVFKGRTYNGADDNASGSAGILQVAKHFVHNPPQNGLMFVHFDAEESHFARAEDFVIAPVIRGAQYFVQNPPLSLDKIKLNINVDMISHNNESELYVLLKDVDATPFRPYLHDEKVKLVLHPKSRWPMTSDSDSFAARGIPYVYFSVQAHEDYHRPSDRFENINKTFVADVVEALIRITRRMDTALAEGKI